MKAEDALPSSRLPPSLLIDEDGAAFSLDARDPGFYADPYPTYAALHARAPIAFWNEAGCLAVADHATVSSILKDRRFGRVLSPDGTGRAAAPSQARPGLRHFDAAEAHSLLELEPPSHTRLRALITRAFVSRQVERLATSIAALADELVRGFRRDGGGDLIGAISEPLPVAIIADLVGLDRAETPLLLAWSHAMVAMYGFARSPAVEGQADRAAAAFTAFVLDLVGRRRARPRDDLLSTLVAAEIDGRRLEDAEIVSTIILLLNAGHEATVHQIGNAVKAILETGQRPSELFADEPSANLLVEECLRFDTPLHLFRRFALEDLALPNGRRLRRGDEVALLLGAANHDPRVFSEPSRFDVRRTPNPHVAFGGGLHFCIGAPLARLELRIALARIFMGLPGLKIVRPPLYRDSFHFRGLERLDVACD